MSIKIAIMASGSGSNAENIALYFKEKRSAEVTLILSNKKNAYVLERAKKLNIRSVVFSKQEFEQSNQLLDLFKKEEIDFIVLAGFLLRVPDNLLRAYPNKTVNIHPALLPKFGGKGMYGDVVHEAVVAAGETQSGITIHYINAEYDSGSVIFQTTCPVFVSDTAADVAAKVHQLEYQYYPQIIEKLILL